MISPPIRLPSSVTTTVRAAIARGLAELESALAAGSPVDSGRFAHSWRRTADTVENVAPYARYVEVDERRADAVIARVDADIVRGVEQQFADGGS